MFILSLSNLVKGSIWNQKICGGSKKKSAAKTIGWCYSLPNRTSVPERRSLHLTRRSSLGPEAAYLAGKSSERRRPFARPFASEPLAFAKPSVGIHRFKRATWCTEAGAVHLTLTSCPLPRVVSHSTRHKATSASHPPGRILRRGATRCRSCASSGPS